jgi:hypothetical protein
MMNARLVVSMLAAVALGGCTAPERDRAGQTREFWLSRTFVQDRGILVVSENPQFQNDHRAAVLRVGLAYDVELIASANVDVPSGASAWLEARLLDQWPDAPGMDASPWFVLASYGAASGTKPPLTKAGGITLDIDTLRFPPRYETAEVRVRSTSSETVVHRIDATTSARAIRPAAERLPDKGVPVVRGLDLGVPFLSQKTSRPELSGRLCSPTSLAMVLNFHGVPCEVEGTAAATYDPAHDIYGNWPRNIQAAYERGVAGLLTRFHTWEAVESTLASGNPIIASIVVEPGELRGAPYTSTDGHLIVIRGIDDRGDLLVNDPAAGTPETGRLTYRRADMERVWFENTKGTAYVLTPRTGRAKE